MRSEPVPLRTEFGLLLRGGGAVEDMPIHIEYPVVDFAVVLVRSAVEPLTFNRCYILVVLVEGSGPAMHA